MATIEDKIFIGSKYIQDCGDSLLVLEKTTIKNNNNHYLFRCQFQKYPYEILETKDHILRGKIGNPEIEKYEFLNNKFLQNCGDYLIPLKKSEKQNNKKDHFYYECSFVGRYSCDNIFALKRNILKGEVWNPNNPNYLNKKEREIYNYIKSLYKDNILKNNWSLLQTREIDIYIPELKIGFEFNGIYWHSQEFKKKYDHLNKLKLANSKGIRLYFIWEDEWDFQKEIIKLWLKEIILLGHSRFYKNEVDKIGIVNSFCGEPELIERDENRKLKCWNCGYIK